MGELPKNSPRADFPEKQVVGPDPTNPTIPVDPTNPEVPPPPGYCEQEGLKPSYAPLARLTDEQYRNTIVDLFGNGIRPGTSFPASIPWEGYTTHPDGNVVTLLGAEDLLEAAEDVGLQIATNIAAHVPCYRDANEACAESWLRDITRRAYRRPATDSEIGRLMALFRATRTDTPFAESLAVTLVAVLQMPEFLYQLDDGVMENGAFKLSDHALAARMSYLLWNTMPDAELRAIADAGQMHERLTIEGQARRMLLDPKSTQALGRFVREWAHVATLTEADKDRTMFPAFNAVMAQSIDQEFRNFVSHVLNTDASFMSLLNSNKAFVNRPMATVYGLDPSVSSGNNDWQEVDLDPNQRSGVLSRAALMATLAHPTGASVVFRGKFVRTQLLCDDIPAPPPDAMARSPEIRADATTRERSQILMDDSYCGGCHRLMNPIGHGFERYDALGQWRATESDGSEVDASGSILGTDVGSFDGAVEMAQALSQAPKVQACFTKHLFRYGFGRRENSYDCSVPRAEASFRAANFNIRELMVALVTSDGFRYRHAAGGAE